MDLDLEHDNKSFKTGAHIFKGEITDKTITRLNRSTEPTDEILLNYDSNTAVRRPSDRHTRQSPEDDILASRAATAGQCVHVCARKISFSLSINKA